MYIMVIGLDVNMIVDFDSCLYITCPKIGLMFMDLVKQGLGMH